MHKALLKTSSSVIKNFQPISRSCLFGVSSYKSQNLALVSLNKRLISYDKNEETEKYNASLSTESISQKGVIKNILKIYDTDRERFQHLVSHLQSLNPAMFFDVKNAHITFKVKKDGAKTTEQMTIGNTTIELGNLEINPPQYRLHHHGGTNYKHETRRHWKVVDLNIYHPDLEHIINDITHCAYVSAISTVIVAAVTNSPAAALEIFYPLFIECLIQRTGETIAKKTDVNISVRHEHGCYTNHCHEIQNSEIQQETVNPSFKP